MRVTPTSSVIVVLPRWSLRPIRRNFPWPRQWNNATLNVDMSFQAANSAVEAGWLSRALGDGEWAHVSGIVPSGFTAYVAVRHPARRCTCTEENLPVLHAGHERGRPVRWAEVAKSDVPVVYGHVLYTKRRITRTRYTQYRRLQDGGWVVDELPGAELLPLLRPGDAWITGPREGSLEPNLARTLQSVLASATEDSVPCWFGIWEGFGYLTESQRAAPAIEALARRRQSNVRFIPAIQKSWGIIYKSAQKPLTFVGTLL